MELREEWGYWKQGISGAGNQQSAFGIRPHAEFVAFCARGL
jgi:hypothetical protein